MTRCTSHTPGCRRRDLLQGAIAAPLLAVIPFVPRPPLDPNDNLELGPGGIVDAQFLAKWQRAAYRSSRQHCGLPQSALELVSLDGGREGYVACGLPADVDELAALALAMIEQDGSGSRIVDVYRTLDLTAAAIIVEVGKAGVA